MNSLQQTAWQRMFSDWGDGLIGGEIENAEMLPSNMRDFSTSVRSNLQWYPHSIKLCEVFDRVISGELRRVMVVTPPQYGKSTFSGVYFPAYFLRKNPSLWVGLASYGASLAINRGRDARDAYIASGGVLRAGAEAGSSWQTSRGGGMWVVGVRGPATGKPASLLIIDDPVKNAEEAASIIVQSRNEQWYKSTWLARESRFADRKLAQVHIQTRWDINDLAGKIIEMGRDDPEPWHVVHFPHLYEEIPSDLYPPHWTVEPDWRTLGDPLCPAVASRVQVESVRAQRGNYFWAAIDQGWPQPVEGGGVFRLMWFMRLPAPRPPASEFVELARAWDIAATRGGGDATSGVLVGRRSNDEIVIIDVINVHESAQDVKALQVATHLSDAAYCAQSCGGSPVVLTPQDPGSAGKADAESTQRLLHSRGAHCEIYRPTGSKRVRARPLASAAAPIEEGGEIISTGRVYVCEAEWTDAFLGRIHNFTGEDGGEDDDVDAASEAFNWLSRDQTPQKTAGVWGWGM